jgi:hypothetical protein
MTDMTDELERLLKAATPGPWQAMAGDPLAVDAHEAVYVCKMTGATPVTRLAANAALIVAAVNALPELVAMAKDCAKLNEPDGVLINMMRGTIPKVSANSLHKLYNAAEVSQAFPELRAVKAALEEIACHAPIRSASGGQCTNFASCKPGLEIRPSEG